MQLTRLIGFVGCRKRAEFGRGPSKYIVDGIESDLKLTIEPGTRGVYCDMTSKGYA